MASLDLMQQLRPLDMSSPGFHDQLSNILYGEEYKRRVGDLQGDDLVSLVDYLDKALDALDPSSSAFRKCMRELRSICGTKIILPTSHILSSSVLNIDSQPVASGGSGDIFKGTLNGSEVCVKRVRIYSRDGPGEATKTLYQEAVMCKRLTHPNIVPLLGITPDPLQLISEWMPGGDLTDYIKKHSGADRVGLLSDIAQGLHFLHSRNIIHGDLKGPNILVDAAGHARITDFGLATVTQNLDSIRSASGDHGHTARWTAPEILSEEGTYSKEADVFSFAMVAIEAFTGAVPFNNGLPAAAMLAIMGGRRPSRPIHPALTDQLWTLIQRCWYQDPNRRPEISEVLKVLGGSEPPPPKRAMSHPPPSPPESQGVGVRAGESKDMKQHDKPQATVQDLSLEQLEDQSNGHDGRIQSRRGTDGSELFPLPIDPQPFDLNGLQGVHGYMNGAGKPDANPKSTPSDSNQPNTPSATGRSQAEGPSPGASLSSKTGQGLPTGPLRSEGDNTRSPNFLRKLINVFQKNRRRDSRAPAQQEHTRNNIIEKINPSQSSTASKSYRCRWFPCL